MKISNYTRYNSGTFAANTVTNEYKLNFHWNYQTSSYDQ